MSKKEYVTAKIAIDTVIFTIHQKKLKVLLHVREKEPFNGKKELLGGLLSPKETAEETLKRKLQQLIGSPDIFCKQFYTFTEPLRDPRERTISIGFISIISEAQIKEENELQWYNFNALPALAFDHKEIIQKARDYLKENIDQTLVKHFIPKYFPLNKLQEIYEILEDQKYDNRNFRKKILYSGVIKEAKQREQNVSHRPAKLYHFK